MKHPHTTFASLGGFFLTADPNLALAGGYANDVAAGYRLFFSLEKGGYEFGWQYRANEGGSGEPTGVFWLRFGR